MGKGKLRTGSGAGSRMRPKGARLRRLLILSTTMLVAVGMISGPALSSNGGLVPFTQAELDDNWTEDRRAPSGGWGSVSFAGRSDVARIGIDSSDATISTFTRTEGIKKIDDFGHEVQVNLYLDPEWQDRAVRAGLWVAGWDPDGTQRSGDFAILEFTTADEIFSPPLGGPVGQNERWRVWHSNTGWIDLPSVPFTYGEWVTLKIVFVPDNDRYDYFIDGVLVESADNTGFDAGFIGEVFFNSYNYGREDMEAGFSNDDYEAHWHVWGNPTSKDDCKKGGFADYGFRNQGQCIKFVNTGKDSR